MSSRDDFVMRRLPSGHGDWRRWIPLALWGLVGLVALIAILTSFYTVEPEGKAVVKRFGRVIGVVGPGLHFKLPLGIDTAQFVPTERVLKEEFGFRTVEPGQRTRYAGDDQYKDESLMLTGDLNVIDVEWVVQYRIREPEKFLHQVRDRTGTIRDVAEAVMRRIVGNRLGSDVLTVGRVSIAAEVRDEMQKILESYDMGVHLTGVELQDVTPPDPVKDAFNKVNEARQEKERLVNLAEKERNRIIPKARGEAAQTVAEAEAYKAERVNRAKGESSRFTALFEQFQQAPEVTRQRLFLETLDTLAPSLGGIYVLSQGSTGPVPLLPLGPGSEALRDLLRSGGRSSDANDDQGSENGGGRR